MAQEFRGKGANIALGPVVGPLGESCILRQMIGLDADNGDRSSRPGWTQLGR
jgi:hypothetical protein